MALAFGNIIVITLMTYYTLYLIPIITNPVARKTIRTNNGAMDDLRKIPVKTLEEQKRFLDLRHPKSGAFRISRGAAFRFVIWTIAAVIVFYSYYWAFSIFRISIALHWAIMFTIISGLLFNWILSFFHLEKENIVRLFR